MKISSIDIYKVDLPFRFAFGHNLATRAQSSNVVVCVNTDDGICGWGEGVPRDYVTGENIESAYKDVSDYIQRFQNWSLNSIEQTLAKLNDEFGFFEIDKKSKGAAWCALELAVLDVLGKVHKKPVAQLIDTVKSDKVRYGAVVPFCSRNKLIAILIFYKLYGFHTVKMKVGKFLEDDIARVDLARKILGEKVVLRVDANCAWNMDQAIYAMSQFRRFNIASIEQPVKADDLIGLKQITEAIPEQVVADESLCTIAQAENLANTQACSGFNIRISKVGGLLAAKKIANIGRKAGMQIHMGAQVGESGILSAAGRTFACTETTLENCEGSNNFFLLKEDITHQNLNVGYEGYGSLLPGNGLGITISYSGAKTLHEYSGNQIHAGEILDAHCS